MVGKLLRPSVIVTFLCLIYCLTVIAIRGNGDPLILMTIGTDYNPTLEAHAYTAEGYDGQFVYYIADNPETAPQYIDIPAYRFQRILLPISGRILALGQSALVPFSLLAVNLLALAGGTYILEQLLLSHNVSRWYALGYGLSIGVFGSARLMTTETLAYALVLLAIWLYHKDRWAWSAAVFALSAFAKEVTLIFVAGYILYMFTQKQFRQGILFALISGIPFAMWQLVLYNMFNEFGVGSGGNLATGFEIIPFMGFFRILLEGGIMIFALLGPIIGLFVIFPTVWSLWQCWRDYTKGNVSLYTWTLLVNSVIMIFVPFSTYREPLGILRFIVGLQIAIIIYSARYRKRRALMYSTIWFITTLFVFISDFSVPGS